MEEATLPSYSSIPLICRLDHLEFIMKYLERKHRGEISAYAEKDNMPLDSTMKDNYFKGSLLDRVTSLEQRLFQLCLEMDSSSSSYLMTLASTQTSGESSSSQSSKTQVFYSFPTFNIPHQHKQISHSHHLQEKSERDQELHQMKNGSPPKEKEEKKRGKRNNNDKKIKGGKKRVPSPWLHFKLLGC